MPLLYPDVIKLDLRLLAERDPLDVARVVTAVGAEAERRHATVLAEGIDSEAQLETARAAGRDARAGLHARRARAAARPAAQAGAPAAAGRVGRRPVRSAALPAGDELEAPDARAAGAGRAGRGDALRAGVGARADRDAAGRAGPAARAGALRGAARLARVRRRRSSPARWRTRGPRSRSGPGFGVCFVARLENDEWLFATSYDRELVVECALLLMARLPQPPPPR